MKGCVVAPSEWLDSQLQKGDFFLLLIFPSFLGHTARKSCQGEKKVPDMILWVQLKKSKEKNSLDYLCVPLLGRF